MRRSRPRAILTACAALALTILAVPAQAQETRGRITGRVTDMGTGQPLAGITVILQGEQGEDASITDDQGLYTFVNLQVGKYVVRFYNASSSTKVERPDLVVSAGATLRADAAIPSQTVVEETYVIKRKAAAVDVGTARLGMTVGEDYMRNIPADRTFGELVLKAPGAFLESSGAVSIAGASGLENVYVMDGLNVTGMEYGDIMSRRSDASGGSNLSLDFVKELQINTGGYGAEFGGAMGGVVNIVTKSGSNEYHGSAFMYWSPYWLSGDPTVVLKKDSALVGVDKPDYDTNFGFELGGPIIKNKLFFWVGFAPRLEKSHFFRDVQALVDNTGPDGMGGPDGVQDIDPKTKQPVTNFLLRTRTRELRQSYQYGAKVDYLVAPDHSLTLGLFATPTVSRHVRSQLGAEAVNDPRWAQEELHKTNTDIQASWVSQLLDRRLRIDASVGLHREDYTQKSPFADLNSINQLEWHSASLNDLENVLGCAPKPNGFDPCPVDNYHNGGFGQTKSFVGNRWAGDLKGTVLVSHNEIKAGAHVEYDTFDQTRYYTGPPGNRRLVQNYPGQTNVSNFFSLPRGRYQFQFIDEDPNNGTINDLLTADPLNGSFYRDELVANVKSINSAYFLQDTFRPFPNLTIDGGIRFENQTLFDFRGDEFLSLNNLGPRLGVVYDPSNEGRSKIFAHYGRFFETIPMNLAARYFGGEGLGFGVYDASTCANPPRNWQGAGTGEWQTCTMAGSAAFNGGGTYPVQPDIKSQYHDEIVAGFRHALTEDLVVGIDYTHRWLGTVIEDGTATDGTFVLGNPGQIPKSVLDRLQSDIDAKKLQMDNAPTPAEKTLRDQELGELKSKQSNLQGLAAEAKPERTYDALTLSAMKRFAKNWMLNGSYTYSRLIGNYNGLFDADNTYFAPNGSNAYDTPELTLNRKGPLANDRPHSGRLDGYYQIVAGKGTFLLGLSFSAYSGVPRNYTAQWIQGVQMVFLLPRGSAGRTDTVTQTDCKVSYHHDLSKNTALEAFVDVFNVFNQRTALQVDDNYTFDLAAPIVNGTTKDLEHAKSYFGTPLTKNSNFGHGTVFQAPVHGRIGLRFLF